MRAEERFVAGFAPTGPSWLRAARQAAIERFTATGFPAPRDENWRHTNLAPLLDTPFAPADSERDGPGPLDLPDLSPCRLVFVNGRLARDLSSTAGLPVAPLADSLDLVEPHFAAPPDGPFSALNAAFWADGAFVHVPAGLALDTPIHLVFVSAARTPIVSHPRVLVIAEPGARAAIIESYVGEGCTLTNAVTEIHVGENARVDHYRIQREADGAFHIASLHARQARHSRFASHAISTGAALARTDLRVTLDGEGAECALNGLYAVGGRQVVDFHTTIDHARPHGTSRELYKGVLDGAARAVFHGKVVVRKDAQKTDAHQTNRNLVLSEGALVHTTPQLEIFASDVKCKHGATIGQIAPEVLFYLRSRGIDLDAARRILIRAFAGEMVQKVGLEPLRARLSEWVDARLPGAAA